MFVLSYHTVPQHLNFVGGIFLISNCLVRVLFGSGPITSFIVASLAKVIGLKVSPIRKIFAVTSFFGYTTSLEGMVKEVVCRFGGIELTTN